MTNYEKQVLNNEITDTMLWSMYNYMVRDRKETINMQSNIGNKKHRESSDVKLSTNNKAQDIVSTVDKREHIMTPVLGLIMAMNMVSREKGGELADEFIRQNTRIKISSTD